MLRPFGHLWPVALLLALPGMAAGQTAGTVTTLPRPADLPPAITPSPESKAVPPVTMIPPADVLVPEFAPEPGPFRRWFDRFGPIRFDAETNLFFPTVNQHLTAPVNVGGLYTTNGTLPSAPLYAIFAPTFGLRVPIGDWGEIGAVYRGLATDGREFVSGVDPAGVAFLRSRLDMHVIDINYYAPSGFGQWNGFVAGEEAVERPRWRAGWDMGIRLASVYFDSRAYGLVVDRRFSNYYFGVGPRAGLTLTRALGDTRVALFGRVDASATVGEVRQQFSELAYAGGVPAAFGYNAQRTAQGVPALTVQVGLSSTAPNCWCGHTLIHWGEWQAGYQYEQWWLVGHAGNSTANLLLHGLFLRWVTRY
jgi:hypothetical protein